MKMQVIAVAGAMFVIGCSHTMPEYVATPVSMPEYAAPIPAALDGFHAPSPNSSLPISLVLDLRAVERTFQGVMPDRFTEENHPLQGDYRWLLVRDGQAHVSIQDGWVTVLTTYQGEIESKTSARGCHLDPVYPVLETKGQLQLHQQGALLMIGLRNTQITMRLRPESERKCNMFNIPVQDQLPELLNRGALIQRVQHAIDDARFSVPLDQVWARVQHPFARNVPNLNAQACVYGEPAELAIGTLEGTIQQSTLLVVATSHPTVTLQSTCQPPAATPLKLSATPSAAIGQGYKIMASVTLPYSVLNQTLQDRLFHQQVTSGAVLKKHIVIENVSASDVSGRILITVRTGGDVVGTIYYWATPKLNRTVLTLHDLQMAVESKAMLDVVKVGYWQALDEPLRKRLHSAAKVDLSERIVELRNAVKGTHQSGDLVMEVRLAQQQVRRAYSTHDAIVTEILLEGMATATVPVAVENASTPQTISAQMPAVNHGSHTR
jgi:Domain of unknown function (DUF4403)